MASLRAELASLRADNEQLRASSALSEHIASTPQYQMIFERLAEGIVLQAADGRILACNPAAERILGLTADQMAGRSSLDPAWRAVHEDGSPFPGDTHPAMLALRTGQPVREVIMGVHKPDGQLTWIVINALPLRDTPDAPPTSVVASFADISAHKLAEERARRSEEDLRFALDAARMGIWSWDVKSGAVAWSPRVEEIFGLPPGGFAGSLDAYRAAIHPDDLQMVDHTVQRTIAPGGQDDYFVEHRVRRPDGSTVWIEAVGRVTRDESGEPVRMDGCVTDVSQRRSLEDQLHKAQRMETVGRLAGGVAHDFNNLLTAIIGSIEIARTAVDHAETSEALESIDEAAHKAARLTAQLLTFARRRPLDLEVLDLSLLVRETERLLTRVIGEDIAVHTVLPTVPVPIRADRTQVEQVLVNLAVNARDAMVKGGRLTIRLQTREAGDAAPGYAVLQISDTGHGIDEDALPHIFDPFFTTKDIGTGLGLATCYGIVTQLGGGIAVESGQLGTTFTITLPLSSDAARRSAPQPQAVRRPGSGRILLVEDDAMVRSVADKGLRHTGYEVVVAAGGPEALSLLERDTAGFDLLLTDVVMPQMSGYELAQQVRKRLPTLPVLFVSGYAEGALERAGPAAKLDRAMHLGKPYTIAQLAAAVKRMVPPVALVD